MPAAETIETTRPIPRAYPANGLEQEPRPVEVDAIALLEIRLRLPRDDCGKVEDDVGATRHHVVGDPGLGDVGDDRLDRKRCIGAARLRHNVHERHARDGSACHDAVAHQPLGELAAEHARRTDNQDAHGRDSRALTDGGGGLRGSPGPACSQRQGGRHGANRRPRTAPLSDNIERS